MGAIRIMRAVGHHRHIIGLRPPAAVVSNPAVLAAIHLASADEITALAGVAGVSM
tara:strand:+ start:854 stop:1018 length:165 start_codon:yes stop_codon:yes gene_type:complete